MPEAELNGLKELLNKEHSNIVLSAKDDWHFIEERSIDEAFFDLRRRQCGYVAAGAADLKSLRAALRRESREYTFGAVWFDEQAVKNQANEIATRKHDQSLSEGEAERQMQNSSAEARRRKEEQQRDWRYENRTRATGLKDLVDTVVKKAAIERKADDMYPFPEFNSWLKGKFEADWDTTGVSSNIEDLAPTGRGAPWTPFWCGPWSTRRTVRWAATAKIVSYLACSTMSNSEWRVN